MNLVVFGLTISSSWGNGHATLLRGLFRALVKRGHRIVFFERDAPYYAAHRDITEMNGVRLIFYSDWAEVRHLAQQALADADTAVVTSYCPDGIAASNLVFSSGAHLLCVFYDLDTPVTLDRLRAGLSVTYIGAGGLKDFDLVLSYTGGAALVELQAHLGARRVAPLYGSVDPLIHKPVPAVDSYSADLSYLGTFADDRQAALNRLFIEAARRAPHSRFLIGGSKYPQDFSWTKNIFYVMHVPPPRHPAFYCSSRLTLNVTRGAMAQMGYCPSGRLFEAAACGVPLVTDEWEGLDQFFTPDTEIIVARRTQDTLEALTMPDEELARVARAARERTLDEYTAERRAIDFETLLGDTRNMPAAGEHKQAVSVNAFTPTMKV
jgi:spore maturation protein CgeB